MIVEPVLQNQKRRLIMMVFVVERTGEALRQVLLPAINRCKSGASLGQGVPTSGLGCCCCHV